MAKSKSGGTRSYLRGKIGADVYSIGKDGKGKKQQVVRSLAEVVANPQTIAQMRGRMIMSTVMQAVSALKPIIDHSFDGIPTGQPNISEFIRRNYALIKADVAAHPASGNSFGLVKYQEKGPRPGLYVVSEGSAVLPSVLTLNQTSLTPKFTIALSASTLTVGGLKDALGLVNDEYITLVDLDDYSGGQFARVRVSTTLDDSTPITAENVASLFSVEGNLSLTFDLDGNTIEATSAGVHNNGSAGLIVSKYVDGVWIHSRCVLANIAEDASYTADVALPTYPIGSEQFLNGGEL